MPSIRYEDNFFTLKILIHLRYAYNLLIYYVRFVDLVKVFDIINNKLLFKIFHKYRAHLKLIKNIVRLYNNLKIIIKIRKLSNCLRFLIKLLILDRVTI